MGTLLVWGLLLLCVGGIIYSRASSFLKEIAAIGMTLGAVLLVFWLALVVLKIVFALLPLLLFVAAIVGLWWYFSKRPRKA